MPDATGRDRSELRKRPVASQQMNLNGQCAGSVAFTTVRQRPQPTVTTEIGNPLSGLRPGGAAAAVGLWDRVGSRQAGPSRSALRSFLPPLLPQPRALVDHQCRDYPRGPVADEPRQGINAKRDEDCGENPEPRHAGFPARLSALRGGLGAGASLLPGQPLPRRSRSDILRGACWAVVWLHAPTIYIDSSRATRAVRASWSRRGAT